MNRFATTYADYQSRAKSFKVGMRVYPFFGGSADRAGFVVQVFPAIGMVDVQFPHGSMRFPVEDLAIAGETEMPKDFVDSVPGGRGITPVSASKVASRYTQLKMRGY